MKKLIFTTVLTVMTVLFSTASSTYFAPIITWNFSNDFEGATNVKWTSDKNMHKVSFIQNNEHKEAFYSVEGELLGITKNIPVTALSPSVKKALAKDFKGFTITEALEYSNASSKELFISAADSKSHYIFKYTSGTLTVFSKR